MTMKVMSKKYRVAVGPYMTIVNNGVELDTLITDLVEDKGINPVHIEVKLDLEISESAK